MKHWILDGAALAPQGPVLSTNGAVDSEGMRHDVRVELNLGDQGGQILFENEAEIHSQARGDEVKPVTGLQISKFDLNRFKTRTRLTPAHKAG